MSGLDESGDYSKRVGETLRGTRRLKKMSLQEVEGLSSQEFKASVLGAYERGERAISVPRLWRLARFYGVEVRNLLPVDESWPASDSSAVDVGESMVVNLVQQLELSAADAEMLKRFLATIAAALEEESGPSPDESNQGCR